MVDEGPGLDPVLLIPGIAGSILNAVSPTGAKERIWVRLFMADREFRSKLWSKFDPETGALHVRLLSSSSEGGAPRAIVCLNCPSQMVPDQGFSSVLSKPPPIHGRIHQPRRETCRGCLSAVHAL